MNAEPENEAWGFDCSLPLLVNLPQLHSIIYEHLFIMFDVTDSTYIKE